MQCDAGGGNSLHEKRIRVAPTPAFPRKRGRERSCAALRYPAAAFFGATLTASLP
jgi:hypothetical protein